MKSELRRIEDALYGNTEIEYEKKKSDSILAVSFYVAPKLSIFDADYLNQFMLGLVPGLENRNCVYPYRYKHGLQLGSFSVREKVGELVLHECLQLDENLDSDESVDVAVHFRTSGYEPTMDKILGIYEKMHNKKEICRTTYVHVCPSVEYLEDIFNNKHSGISDFIDNKDLRKYNPNRWDLLVKEFRSMFGGRE